MSDSPQKPMSSGGDMAERAAGGGVKGQVAGAAVDAATGRWDKVTLRALKNPWALLTIPGCSVFLVAFFIIFFGAIISGGSASISKDDEAGLCKKIAGVTPPKTITDQANNPDYKKALLEAEKATGTSRFLIESVDYQESKLGTNDPARDTLAALKDFGNKIQIANYARNSDGSLKTDASGAPIKALPNITGKVTDNMAAALALINYNCVFVEHKAQSGNLNDPDISQVCFVIGRQDCLKKGLANKWIANPPLNSRQENVGNDPANPNDMGAFLFYLYISKSQVCPTATAALPGPGKPGAYIDGWLPDVILYSQIDPQWTDKRIGPGGCESMGYGGCGLTSTAMVLYWYGKNTTPATVADVMGGSYYDCDAGMDHGAPNYVAGAVSGGSMGAETVSSAKNQGNWDEVKRFLSGEKFGKPVPIIINVTHKGFGHVVVLKAYKNGKLYINDPMPGWYGPEEDEGYIYSEWQGWAVYVH